MSSSNLWSRLNSAASTVYETTEKLARNAVTDPSPSSAKMSDGDSTQQEFQNLRRALERAEQQNSMLTAEFERIIKEKDKESSKFNDMNRSSESLEQTPLRSRQGSVATTSSTTNETSTDVHELQTQNAELNNTLANLKKRAKAKILELQADIETLQKSSREKDAALERFQSSDVDDARRVESERNANEALQALTAEREKSEKLRADLRFLQKKLDEFQNNANQNASAESDALQAEIRSLKEQLDSLVRKNTKDLETTVALKTENKSLQEKIETLLSTANDSLPDLESERATTAALRSETESLRTQLVTLKDETTLVLSTERSTSAKLASENRTLQQTIDAMSASAVETSEETIRRCAELDARADDALRLLKEKKEALNLSEEQWGLRLRELENQLLESKKGGAESSELTEENDKLKRELEDKRNRSGERIAELERRLAEANDERHGQARVKLDALEKEKENLKASFDVERTSFEERLTESEENGKLTVEKLLETEQALQRTTDEKERMATRLEEEEQRALKNVKELEEELATRSTVSNSDDVVRANDRIAELESLLAKSEEKMIQEEAKLEQVVEENSRMSKDSEKKRLLLQTKIYELETGLTETTSALAEQREKSATLAADSEAARKSLLQEKQSLQRSLTEASEIEHKILTDKIQTMENELLDAQNALTEERERSKEIATTAVSKLERSLKILAEEKENLNRSLENAQEELESSRQRSVQLDEEISRVRQDRVLEQEEFRRNREAAEAAVKADIAKYEAAQVEQTQERDLLETKLREVQLHVSALEEEKATLTETIRSHETELDRRVAEEIALSEVRFKGELESLENRLQVQIKERDEELAKRELETSENERSKEHFRRELTEGKELCRELEVQLTDAKERANMTQEVNAELEAMRAEKQQLQDKCESVSSTAESLEATVLQLRDALQVQEEEVKDLSNRLKTRAKSAESAEVECQRLREELSSVINRLGASEEQAANQLANERAEAKKVSQSYAALFETHTQTSSLLEETRRKLESAEESRRTSDSTLSTLGSNLAATRAELAALKERHLRADSLADEKAATEDSLRLKTEQLERLLAERVSECESAASRTTHVQLELERLERDMAEKDALLHRYREEVDEFKEELAELARHNEHHTANLVQQHESELESYRESEANLTQLREELAELRTARTVAEDSARSRERDLKRVQAELAGLLTQKNDLEMRLATINRTVPIAASAELRLPSPSQPQQSQIQALERDKSRLTEQLHRLRAEYEEQFKSSRSASLVNNPPGRSDLLDRIEHYTIETARLQNENNRLRERLQDSEQLQRDSGLQSLSNHHSSTRFPWSEDDGMGVDEGDRDLEAPGSRPSIIVLKGRNRIRRTVQNVVRELDINGVRFIEYLKRNPISRLSFQAYVFLLHIFLVYVILYAGFGASQSVAVIPNAGSSSRSSVDE